MLLGSENAEMTPATTSAAATSAAARECRSAVAATLISRPPALRRPVRRPVASLGCRFLDRDRRAVGQAGLAVDDDLFAGLHALTDLGVLVVDDAEDDGAALRLFCRRHEDRRLLAFADDRLRRDEHDVGVFLGIDLDLHRRARPRASMRRRRKLSRTGAAAVPGSTAAGRDTTFSGSGGASSADDQPRRSRPRRSWTDRRSRPTRPPAAASDR